MGTLREEKSPLCPTVSGLWGQEHLQGEGDGDSIAEEQTAGGLAPRWNTEKSSSSQAACLVGWSQGPCREWVGTISRGIGGTPHRALYMPLHGPYFPFRICPNANVSISSFVAKDHSLQGLVVSVGRRSLLRPLWVNTGRTQHRAEMGETT